MSEVYIPPVQSSPRGLPQQPGSGRLGKIGLVLSFIAPAVVAWLIVFPPG